MLAALAGDDHPWVTLTGAASESAALVTGMLDRQITSHVASLIRAVAAATTVGAAEAGLEDGAQREVDLRSDVLEEQSRALVEVRGG